MPDRLGHDDEGEGEGEGQGEWAPVREWVGDGWMGWVNGRRSWCMYVYMARPSSPQVQLQLLEQLC